MAWDSKEGIIIDLNKNETFFTSINTCLNTIAGKTTTYKYALIKSILDNLFNVNTEYQLGFADLEKTFLKLYWNLINVYSLPQKHFQINSEYSTIELIIKKISTQNSEIIGVGYDSLKNDIKNEYIKTAKGQMEKYVVGALYSELNGKIYGFNKTNKLIYFNNDSYNFLLENKIIIEKLNYFAWIVWIEAELDRRNRSENNIAIKIDDSTKRKTLNSFKKELLSSCGEATCFYCNKQIKSNKCHVDHFIPWKFVKDDKIWNLVLSCSICNLSKNDKIPDKKFLAKIIDRNRKYFGDSREESLLKLYNSAVFNGFSLWK